MATTPNYDINYEDERFSDVKTEETQQLTELEQTYNGMIGSSDKFYQDQTDASNAWAEQQKQLQQEQTDFTIEQIEQQKEQAAKDYTKEQAGAYVDWRKQSNEYGTEAEKMASAGLTNTGFSESSQVSMYNTYQNRVATARESFNQAVLNYNNAIKDARLQNNAALAEIAANALQTQLELSLQGFQYKNQLILDLTDKKMQTKKFYADQWQRVLDQMNKENDRQWQTDENTRRMEWESKEAELNREHNLERDRIKNEFSEKLEGIKHEYSIKLLKATTEKEKEVAKYEHDLALEKLAEEQKNALDLLDKKLANDKALAKYNYDLKQSKNTYTFSGGSSGGSSSGSKGSSNKNSSNTTFKDKWASIQSSFKGTTYKEASAYLKSKNITNGAMTESEWSRRKNSYSMTGQGAEEVKRFNSYADYIQAYVKYNTSG
jgi:hypothetical protein